VGGLRRRAGRGTRIFYAADLHGSELAYRKFLAAAEFYGVHALVFGGDLMGKLFVPIVRENGTYRAEFQQERHEFDTDGLEPFTRSVERGGCYWRVMERDAYDAASLDPFAQQAMFQEAARERLAAWIDMAEDRLAGSGVRLFMTGGNDDDPSVLETLHRHAGEHVVPCEGRVVELDAEHTMATVGWSTQTPWDTPREASEDEIAAMIEVSVAQVPDVARCIFNFHCPPKDTPIDTCLKLEKASDVAPGELPRPVRDGGRFHFIGGGSQAVRDAVSRYQPAIGLHGHIHESPGWFRIGRTRCFNPGSEYGQGLLAGWIVAIRGGALSGYQHTWG
jgi:Icc-related predicted phosphoesterase